MALIGRVARITAHQHTVKSGMSQNKSGISVNLSGGGILEPRDSSEGQGGGCFWSSNSLKRREKRAGDNVTCCNHLARWLP
jgi:hypothetical protein